MANGSKDHNIAFINYFSCLRKKNRIKKHLEQQTRKNNKNTYEEK